MPRPHGTRTVAQKTSMNPIAALLAKREQHKQELKQQAAMQITNDTAKNEEKIKRTLMNIDFIGSKIPAQILESKRNPSHNCGDLEYGARAAVQALNENQLTTKVDLRPIDAQLLKLAEMFSENVKNGNVKAAYAAKTGLIRGLNTIRSCVPEVQSELATQFVTQNAEYLTQWVQMVEEAEAADKLERNVARRETEYNKAIEVAEKRKDEFTDKVKNDTVLLKAFMEVKDDLDGEDTENWPKEKRDMRSKLIGQLMKDVEIDLKELLLNKEKENFMRHSQCVEILNAKLMSNVVVMDPNAMQKFNDAVDEMFMELDKSDQEMKQMLETNQSIEARIKQLEHGEGQQLMDTMAARKARELLERDQKNIQRTLQKRTSIEELQKKAGFMTQKEYELALKEVQEQQNVNTQELHNEN